MAVSMRPAEVTAAAVPGDSVLWLVRGVDGQGNRVRQPVRAGSEIDAVNVASVHLGIQVSNIERATGRSAVSFQNLIEELGFYRNLDENKALFWTTASDVMRSGGTMQDAVSDGVQNISEPRFRGILQSVVMDIAGRRDVDEAMGQFPEVFTAAEIELIRLGKRELPMAKVVERISLDYTRQNKMALKVFSSAAAGQFTTWLALIMIVVAGKVIPAIYEPIYQEAGPGGTNLSFGPFTLAAKAVSDFVLSPWSVVFVLLFGLPLYYGWQKFRRRETTRRYFENMQQSSSAWSRVIWPLAGIRRSLAVERMCTIFAMLLATGKLNFQQAVPIVARSLEGVSIQLSDTLIAMGEEMGRTRVDVTTAVASFLAEYDQILVSRFRTAAQRNGKQADIFAERADALAFRIEFKDLPAVGPRVELSSYIPAVLATAWAGLAFFEPIIRWISNAKIHP